MSSLPDIRRDLSGLSRVIAYPHPFRLEERRLVQLRPGQTLQNLLEELQPNPHLRPAVFITINGEPVAPEHWPHLIPAPGSLVIVKILPQSGVLKIFVAIAAIVASVLVPWTLSLTGLMATFVGGLAGMAVGIVGNLLVNALVPPPRPPSPSPFGNQQQDPPTQFVSGARNQMLKWGTVPFLLGYHRLVPLKMAEDVSEAQGNHQYVRCLFGQYGPLEVSGLKIGNTAISKFSEVEVEFRNLTYIDPDDVSIPYGNTPLVLFTNDIHEEPLSILLEYFVNNIRTSQPGARELSVDITLPQGIYHININNSGVKEQNSVSIRVEYRISGSADPWVVVGPETPGQSGTPPESRPGIDLGTFAARYEPRGVAGVDFWITGQTGSAIRRGLRWAVNPAGDPEVRYDVRVTRFSPPDDNFNVTTSYWTALRTLKAGPALTFPDPLMKIGVRIQASEQLNGTLDEFNFLGRSILPDWSAGTATWIARATNNPASLLRAVLQSAASPNPLPDSRLDLVKLQSWHEYCTAQGFAYNKNIDQRQDWRALCQEIAAAGRAAISDYDGKISVILDEPQAGRGIPLNPRVVKDLEVEINYPDLPHAFRCPFKNEAADYQDDERVVLDDGYAELNNGGELVDAWGNSAVRQINSGAPAVNLGNGVVGLPCNNHGLRSGWSVTVAGTANYNGTFTVLPTSTMEQVNIRASFVAETFIPGGTISLAVATKFEQLALPGITNAALIFKLARYHIAVARLRYRKISFLTNIQQLVFTRGDKVELAHDVMLAGLAYGRVKALIYDGDDIIGCTLDAPMSMEADQYYGLVFRSPVNGTLNYQVVTSEGESQTVTFIDPITPEDLAPAVGDLATFGLFGQETIPIIITDIQQRSGLWAKITAADEAPEIHDADQGLIPEHISRATLPADLNPPVILSLRSDAAVMAPTPDGSWLPRILAVFQRRASLERTIAQMECQYWPADFPQTPAALAAASFAAGEISLLPVDSGLNYSLRFRYVNLDGSRGNWSPVYQHITSVLIPADVDGLTTFYRANQIYLSWSPILGVSSYEVRKGTAWGTGEILGFTTLTEFPCRGDGTYFVAARIGNNYSAIPASVAVSDANLPGNIVAEYDEKATGWSGTLTNLTRRDDGNLELIGAGDFDTVADADLIPDADLYGGVTGNTGIYEIPAAHIVDLGTAQACTLSATYGIMAINPQDDIYLWEDVYAVADIYGNMVGVGSVSLQVCIALDDEVFSDWQIFVPGVYRGRKFKFRFLVSSLSPTAQVIVTGFDFCVDMPDRIIDIKNQTCPVEGLPVTFIPAFQIAPAKVITVLDAVAGDTVVFPVAFAPEGGTVQVKNGGVPVARQIDGLFKGY